jgi:DNA-binding NtrC family response regulator
MDKKLKVLVAEDDAENRLAWAELIRAWGYQVVVAEDGQQALDLLDLATPDILLLDFKMPRKDGLQVLEEIKRRAAEVPALIVSGVGEIPDVVRAMKLGAYDYLEKPVDPGHLRIVLTNLVQYLDVRAENRRLRRRLQEAGELGRLVGRSAAMRRVMALIEQIAPTASSAMIVGESGTGKELVARTIHDLSERRGGPFVAVNCAALPETLIESELFGHERGAFTGADRRREGCFELANAGTLFLDEIGEMRLEAQSRLLRAIEERRFRRVGGSVEIAVDVRILAATHHDLEKDAVAGRFRRDLFYRLNVFAIEMPPLRERPDDIPALVEHMLKTLPKPAGKEIAGIDDACLESLKRYRWPGNVRELRNVIERALVLAKGPLISAADLPPQLVGPAGQLRAITVEGGLSLDEMERRVILQTIELVGGNKSRAAEMLGISLKTLYNKLDRYRTAGGPALSG